MMINRKVKHLGLKGHKPEILRKKDNQWHVRFISKHLWPLVSGEAVWLWVRSDHRREVVQAFGGRYTGLPRSRGPEEQRLQPLSGHVVGGSHYLRQVGNSCEIFIDSILNALSLFSSNIFVLLAISPLMCFVFVLVFYVLSLFFRICCFLSVFLSLASLYS